MHGCALCQGTQPLLFVEDVGRHNAADAIAGYMWLDHLPGADKIFYTTGRLTSEIVMKVAHMGIPVLLSRSGVTQMGLELARELGVSYATVNRWENGQAKPSKLARAQLDAGTGVEALVRLAASGLSSTSP